MGATDPQMEQQTTPDQPEVSNSLTEDQAAAEMLKRWGAPEADEAEEQSPDPEEPQADAEPEQSEQDDAEGEDEADDDAGEESGDIEIDVGGEKLKVPKAAAEVATRIQAKVKEIEAGATRKFQEAAETRKAAEAQIEQARTLQTIAQSQADLIADHKLVMRRLQVIESMDVSTLGDTDPVALTKLNAEYNQLQAAKARIEQQYQVSVQQLTAQQQQAARERMERLEKHAAARIKGWGQERSSALAEYAKSKGYTPERLAAVLDEAFIEILDDAAHGHALRTARPAAKRVATPNKTLTPNAAGTGKTAAVVKAEKATARLRSTGSVEDAAMALLARSSIRKR